MNVPDPGAEPNEGIRQHLASQQPLLNSEWKTNRLDRFCEGLRENTINRSEAMVEITTWLYKVFPRKDRRSSNRTTGRRSERAIRREQFVCVQNLWKRNPSTCVDLGLYYIIEYEEPMPEKILAPYWKAHGIPV